jgi:hypothetical protein
MFERRHYIAIAKVLNQLHRDYTFRERSEDVIVAFTDMFEKDNKAFDEDKFNAAVYMSGDF